MILFSLLVANYNNGHFFRDCYKSIINQTYTNWEVVIVDDASTDNSIQEINKLINGDSRFQLFRNDKNYGCGYTKNRCASLAKGEVLGFLDPDDAIKPNALEVMIEAHELHPYVAIVTSKYEFVDLQMNFIRPSLYGCAVSNGKSYLTYGKGALTHFATFKKEKYLQSEGINPFLKRAVDQDLYYKMEEQGKHYFLDKVLYRYRIHKKSISNNENLYKAEYWHFYVINKAYKRRKKSNLEIDNFSEKEMRLLRSNYYLSRFEKLKFSKKKSAQFYFLFKAIKANPLHRFQFKFKSLVVLVLGRI